MPESDALLLLDNFTPLLEVWAKRLGSTPPCEEELASQHREDQPEQKRG